MALGEGARVIAVKLMIAEDQELVREGLAALLKDTPGVTVDPRNAADGLEAVKLMANVAPDLVIMDLFMPNMDGVNATREIKRRYPKVKVLILTMSEAEAPIADALKAGADGYLMKRASRDEFLKAIDMIMAGRPYYSDQVSIERVKQRLQQPDTSDASAELKDLTYRERQILKLVAEGRKNKEMAELLGISLKTVETHRLNMMRKLGLHSGAEITAFAFKAGLLEQPPS